MDQFAKKKSKHNFYCIQKSASLFSRDSNFQNLFYIFVLNCHIIISLAIYPFRNATYTNLKIRTIYVIHKLTMVIMVKILALVNVTHYFVSEHF